MTRKTRDRLEATAGMFLLLALILLLFCQIVPAIICGAISWAIVEGV